MPTQALAFLAVFVYTTRATQAIAFKWKSGLSRTQYQLVPSQLVLKSEPSALRRVSVSVLRSLLLNTFPAGTAVLEFLS